MINKYIITALLLVCSITASAQNNQNDNEKNEIYDRVWILNRLNNKKINYKQDGERITLIITRENEYASGSSGCNTYVSQVVIKRNHIMFRSIGATRMACPDDNLANERIYLNNLNDVDSFKIIDEDLYLYKNERPVLIYTKE
ncbi:MAG: META domain-containing protein [Bacteroidales bacterium]|nr:META domain-containing protein [Bacteroidales bacterium]